MINPAIGTRWYTEKNGKPFYLVVNGIIATGVRDTFQVISYELKYDHLEKLQIVPAAKMLDFITSKKLIYESYTL